MKNLIFHEFEQGSEVWKEWRLDKIGGSDIAVIMGISPFCSPYMLWKRKLKLVDEQEQNQYMARGSLMENDARREYCRSKNIEMTPKTVSHPYYPYFIASLDGISSCGDKLVEIKCGGKKLHEDALKGIIPDYYIAQMQWQMFCTCCFECDYYSYDGNSGVVITISRDDDLIERMKISAKEFLNCLRTITPPAFTELDYEDKSNDPYWESLMAQMEAIKEEIRKLDNSYEAMKALAIHHSEGRNVKGSNSTFTKVVTKGRVQYDKIPEIQNIDLEPFRGPTTESYRITIKKDSEL